MKTLLRSILFTALALPTFASAGQQTLVEYLTTQPQYSTLVEIAKRLNLVDTLNESKMITVFAPTNDAFEKLDFPVASIKDDRLKDIILTHILPERKYSISILLSFAGQIKEGSSATRFLTESLSQTIAYKGTRFLKVNRKGFEDNQKVCLIQVLSQVAKPVTTTIGSDEYGTACVSTNYDVYLANNVVVHEIDDVIVSTTSDLIGTSTH